MRWVGRLCAVVVLSFESRDQVFPKDWQFRGARSSTTLKMQWSLADPGAVGMDSMEAQTGRRELRELDANPGWKKAAGPSSQLQYSCRCRANQKLLVQASLPHPLTKPPKCLCQDDRSPSKQLAPLFGVCIVLCLYIQYSFQAILVAFVRDCHPPF